MEAKSVNQRNIANVVAAEYNNLLDFVRARWRSDAERDAEDILQDVVTGLFTKVDFSKPIENVAGYIYRSLRNRIIDLQRKRKHISISLDKEEETDEGSMVRQLADQGHDVPSWSRNEKLQNRMMRAIDQLKPEQQDIIYATEFEGYSYEELSREWEVPIGTLLARKHRALAKLNKMLSDEKEKLNNV